MNIKQKWVFLFLILLFPSLTYLVLSTGKIHFTTLPIYGPRTVVDSDTVFHTITNFNLPNHKGESVSLTDFEGKYKIVNFICAECETSVDRLNGEFAQLQLQFKNRTDLSFLTFIINSDNFDKASLASFVKSQEPGSFWFFIQTDASVAKELALKSFLLKDFSPQKGSDYFVLLDQQNRIRGFYNGIEYVKVKELIDAVKVLKAEEFRPMKGDKNIREIVRKKTNKND